MFPKFTLILGGARSGKSDYGEALITATGKPAIYLASAQAHDAEMSARIARHQSTRGAGWRTLEVPFDVASALRAETGDEAVLFDCATLWLSNHMLADHDLEQEQAGLLAALESCAAPVVVVTNELGHGVVPDNELARRFRDAQGLLNQQLAAQADLVVFVTAGLGVVLKGRLPAGFP